MPLGSYWPRVNIWLAKDGLVQLSLWSIMTHINRKLICGLIQPPIRDWKGQCAAFQIRQLFYGDPYWSIPNWQNAHVYLIKPNVHHWKEYEMSGKDNGNTRIWHFDFLEMAWHQPQTNSVTLMQLSRVVLWIRKQLAMSEIKNTQ